MDKKNGCEYLKKNALLIKKYNVYLKEYLIFLIGQKCKNEKKKKTLTQKSIFIHYYSYLL